MIKHICIKILIKLKMKFIHYFLWNPLIKQTYNPSKTQETLLHHIIQKQKDTIFGNNHQFDKIHSYAEYSSSVPIQSYEDLRPYIESQEQEGKPYLTKAQTVMYSVTSGTETKSKLIPFSHEAIKYYKHNQHIVAYSQYKDISHVYDGKILAIVSPSQEGILETGTPYGSMSGLIYQSMPKLTRLKYVVPPQIFANPDYQHKYYLIALFALAEKDISLIATANPSTLLMLHTTINEKWHELIRDLESKNHNVDVTQERIDELLNFKQCNTDSISFADLWPNVKSVTTWTNGNCTLLIPKVRRILPTGTKIVEMGYVCSEFRGSITVDLLNNKSIPTIHENFFEFVERNKWENKKPEFLTIDQLQLGTQYYLFVTTQHGLYRYAINDIIEVDGYFNNTPTIRFIQKGIGATNITGEKLYEYQIVQAIKTIELLSGHSFHFFMMLADPAASKYVLYIESTPFPSASEKIEEILQILNSEFKQKRQSNRLKQTEIRFLKKGTMDVYKKHCIDNGKRDGQFKLVKLLPQNQCSFNFDHYLRESA